MIELIGLAILSVLFTEWFEPIQEVEKFIGRNVLKKNMDYLKQIYK